MNIHKDMIARLNLITLFVFFSFIRPWRSLFMNHRLGDPILMQATRLKWDKILGVEVAQTILSLAFGFAVFFAIGDTPIPLKGPVIPYQVRGIAVGLHIRVGVKDFRCHSPQETLYPGITVSATQMRIVIIDVLGNIDRAYTARARRCLIVDIMLM